LSATGLLLGYGCGILICCGRADAIVNTEDVNVGQTPNSLTVNPKLESIRAISAWFANTVYGFFLGKRVAYPVVANYVRNTWCWDYRFEDYKTY
ncbi:hypothetical protein Tco_1022253, partial [Tanacetum coccineum]